MCKIYKNITFVLQSICSVRSSSSQWFKFWVVYTLVRSVPDDGVSMSLYLINVLQDNNNCPSIIGTVGLCPQHSPSWKAKTSSASLEVPRIFWNPTVHCRIHKSPPTVPNLSQINSVHATPSHILMINFNIILPCMPGSSNWLPSLGSLHRNPSRTSALPHTYYIPRPSHSFLFDQPNNIWWGV
jgi:hypothetical protein